MILEVFFPFIIFPKILRTSLIFYLCSAYLATYEG